jgi:TetR/AcrR family transcriptional regulator, lmrAB and yxaGH operons repressor
MTETTRQRMLTATAELLQERGFRGTSLNDILEESDAPRGSIYYHFPGGKEELALEATRLEVQGITDYLVAAFENAAGPVEAVRAYVQGAREHTRTSGYRLGCPVASLILGGPEPLSSLAEVCRQALEEWHEIIRDGLAAGGVSDARADSLATLILTSVEGALIMARSRRDPAPLDTLADELAGAVDAALEGVAGIRGR